MADLQTLFESTLGQVVTVIVILILFLTILISGKSKKPDTKALVISAILVALSMVLSSIVLFRMPQGGSVTPFGMLPIALAAYFFGVRRGLMVGICVGLLNLIIAPYVIHPAQMLIDYPLAFGALAFGGIFRNVEKFPLPCVYLFGVLCRYACAVLSGVIFFGSYAPEGFNALTWSLWYNATYLAVEGAITAAILFIPSISNFFRRLRKEAEGDQVTAR